MHRQLRHALGPTEWRRKPANRSQLSPARGGPARQVRVALTAARGRTQLKDALVLHGESESVAVLRVRCLNAMARQDVTGKHIVPPFPSRPIALLNIRAPDSHIWYEAAHSDWLHETDPKPFEIPVRFDFFERIQQMEVCLLDLEDGSGTAKLQVRQRPARCVPCCVCKLAERLAGQTPFWTGQTPAALPGVGHVHSAGNAAARLCRWCGPQS